MSDAMLNGGNLTLSTRKLETSAEVQVEVRDDGVGMPKDVLAKMFEPFFTTKEHGRGLGLGLAISRNIVDRHAGKIEVASVPGHGTTFTIILPLQSSIVHAAGPAVTSLKE
jgi:signal transduction histidine kinase